MIVLLATVVVVCAGIVVVAWGRGGQLAEFGQDAPPLELPARRPIAGTDVALLRLPTGPWGYSYRATDDALRRIAHAITERDTRIAVLEQQVSELRSALPGSGDTGGGESGSPWFDRSASFEGRRPPVSSRTGEPAAIGPQPVDTPEEPVGAEPGDPATGAGAPHAFGRTDDAFADFAPEHGTPEDAEPDAPAGPAWVVQKAWTPSTPWSENGTPPKTAEPVDDEPEAETAEADEGWAFGDDAEPADERAAEPDKPPASAFGSSPESPWPGDRLVATSRPRTGTEDEAGEKSEDETDTAEGKADEIEDDAADAPADELGEPADGEPRGEGH